MFDESLLKQLQDYIKRHTTNGLLLFEPTIQCNECFFEDIQHNELDDFIKNSRMPTFKQVLFRFIDRKGASDSDIYKRAGLDRRHFSKIRSNDEYRPGKNSAIALAMALELNKKETDELLSAAGYSLSESDTFDLVIQFCLEKKIYELYNINQALDYFSLKPLAGALE